MDLTVVVECLSENGTVLSDSECPAKLSVLNTVLSNLPDTQTVTNTPHLLHFRARIIQINSLLNAISFTSEKNAKVRMTITVNDNGNTGACSLVPGQPVQRFCPLQAQFVANIEVAPATPLSTSMCGRILLSLSSFNLFVLVVLYVCVVIEKYCGVFTHIYLFLLVLVIIAATAGAAAAVGLGVAATLWSKFSGTASRPDYQPWNFDNVDSVVNNPLHQSSTTEIRNPLHSANQ
jgi:hypothetical protein